MVNSKGGTGKSTLTINLAVTFSDHGFRVLVIDVDDQNSVSNWFTNTADSEAAKKVAVVSLGVKHLRTQLEKVARGYDVVLIDGKGSRDKSLSDILAKSVIQAADFSIIPIVPDELNKDATEDFVDEVLMPLAEYEDIKCGLLISRHSSTVLSRSYANYYRDLDFPVFESVIPDRNIFKASVAKGLCCFQFKPDDKGSIAFLELFYELCSAIGIKYGKKRVHRRPKISHSAATRSASNKGSGKGSPQSRV